MTNPIGSVEIEVTATLKEWNRRKNQVKSEAKAFNREVEKLTTISTPILKQQEVNRAVASYQKMAKGTKGIGVVAQQAGYQVGDFAVQVASGQSALIAFTQQGTQLLGVFGAWGAVAGAAIAVGGALANSFMGAKDSASQLETALSSHESLVRRITEAYGDAASGVRAYAEESKATLQALANANAFSLEQQLQKTAQELLPEATRRMIELRQELRESGKGSAEAEGKFLTLSQALSKTSESAQKGAPEVGDLRTALEDMSNSMDDKAVKDYAAELLNLLDPLMKASRGFKQAADNAAILNAQLDPATRDQREKLANIYGQMADSRDAPAVESMNAFYTLRDRNLRKTKTGSKRKSTRGANTFGNATQSLQEQIRQLEIERTALGMNAQQAALYRAEQEAVTMQLRLLNAAKADGQGVSAQEQETVDALTEQYRNQKVALIETKEQQASVNYLRGQFEQAGLQGIQAFTSEIKTGNDALDRMIQNLIDAAAQAALFGKGPLSGIFGGKGGGGIGGILGGIFGGGGGGIGPGFLFANGGIMSSGGPLPLKAYSKGGIASGPQMAIYGEGRQNEAYVPLPDGRTIPVTMTMPAMAGAPSGGMSAVKIFLADGLRAELLDEANQGAVQIVAASAPSIAENAVGKTKKGIAKGDFDGSMGRYAARPSTRAR